jgi:hypothetical protein
MGKSVGHKKTKPAFESAGLAARGQTHAILIAIENSRFCAAM